MKYLLLLLALSFVSVNANADNGYLVINSSNSYTYNMSGDWHRLTGVSNNDVIWEMETKNYCSPILNNSFVTLYYKPHQSYMSYINIYGVRRYCDVNTVALYFK